MSGQRERIPTGLSLALKREREREREGKKNEGEIKVKAFCGNKKRKIRLNVESNF
jgi:hypothetical protein